MESVYYAGLYSQLHTGSNADLYILWVRLLGVHVLYSFVLPASHTQPNKTIHFMSETICTERVYNTDLYLQLHRDSQAKLYLTSEIIYRGSVLYRFVLTAAHSQAKLHILWEIMCRVCVLYRCVLPAAHRQPGRSGQSQQGGTRVHRVQAVLGQPRFGGHVGSRGPHQQPQRYGEVVLSGKRLNPNILLYEKSTCKTNLYHGNDCNQSSQDTIHSKRNIFRQFFFTLQHGPNRLLLVLLMGWAFDVSNNITLHELLPLCTAFIPMSQTKYSCLYIIMQFWAKIDFWRAAINPFYLLSFVGRTIDGRADTDIWTTIIFLLHEERHCTHLIVAEGRRSFCCIKTKQRCSS